MLLTWLLLLCAEHAADAYRVVVAGATHGNELSGAWVLRRLKHRECELAARYSSLQVEGLLANPHAHAANTRFVDTDLNREFSATSLARPPADCGYEAQRAMEIAAAVGPSSAAQADLVIDLHTTTTNMGCTLIVGTYSSAALATAAYIAQQWARPGTDAELSKAFPLRVLIDPQYGQEECPYLCSLGRHGFEVEVGPTPQGLLRADVIAATERAVELALEYCELVQTGAAPPTPASLTGYVDAGKLAWPHEADDAMPSAMIHPHLQGRDFAPLKSGDPLWIGIDGETTYYDGAQGDDVVPIFVNEAAYYHAASGRGFGLCRPIEWSLCDGDSSSVPPAR